MNTENLTATSVGETINPLAVGEVSTDVVYIGETTSAILTPWMEEMETQVGSNTSAISSINAIANSFAGIVDSLETTVGTVADVCDSLETQVGALNTTVTTDSGRIDTLETVVDTMETTVGTLTTDVAGLETTVESMDSRITALENGGTGSGSGEVAPMCIASMHLGKLDNNSGAEVSSSTRICSEPIAVENGKSYWQVNDKAANFYVLLYDADEVFLSLHGSVASGAEFTINAEGVAYMRLGSLLGDNDLTNEIRIYDVDPASTGSDEGTAVDAYTKEEADARFAMADHTHDGYAAVNHTHTADQITGLPSSVDAYSKTEMDTMLADKAAASHTHTAADITGLPSSVDAYSKTEVDTMMEGKAESEHTHDGYATAEALNSVDSDVAQLSSDVANFHSELNLVYNEINGKAPADHTHDEYVSASDLSGKADTDHTHTYSEVGAAASNHTHTPASIGAAASSHTHTPASIGAAASNHTHSGYASSTHTHSGYASSDHTHSQYSQSGHSHTTNGSCEFTGSIRTRDIVPDANDSRNIGGYSNRYKMIYSVNQLQVSSDERAKKDIRELSVVEMADFVNTLNVVEYKYKSDASNKARIGLIAQEIVKANPELAAYFVREEENGMLGLSVADLVFPLIAAVQDLQKQINGLKK